MDNIFFGRSLEHHVSKRCSENKTVNVMTILAREIFSQSQAVAMESRKECEGLAVCKAVKILSKMFLNDAINLQLLQSGYIPFMSWVDCEELFPLC